VSFVHANSPAALVGLRFGDQILQINGENVAGWDTDKVFKVLKKTAPERLTMAVRDRLAFIAILIIPSFLLEYFCSYESVYAVHRKNSTLAMSL